MTRAALTLRLALLAALAIVSATASAAEVETPLEIPRKPDAPLEWEGAMGLTTQFRPEYQGFSPKVFKVTPALFLRYGRFTINNASGFVTRREDDVVRGLGIDLGRSETVRSSIALRFDAGRGEGTSSALTGLGDVKPTVRARLATTWQIDWAWRAGASLSADAFGRGGGSFGDVSVAWETRWKPSTVLTVGGSLSAAGDRYMQTYYGISPAQAARTSYAVYEPGSGLRDIGVYANMRHDLARDWTVIGGIGVSRLLGPAAASPLATTPGAWATNLGAAWRF